MSLTVSRRPDLCFCVLCSSSAGPRFTNEILWSSTLMPLSRDYDDGQKRRKRKFSSEWQLQKGNKATELQVSSNGRQQQLQEWTELPTSPTGTVDTSPTLLAPAKRPSISLHCGLFKFLYSGQTALCPSVFDRALSLRETAALLCKSGRSGSAAIHTGGLTH